MSLSRRQEFSDFINAWRYEVTGLVVGFLLAGFTLALLVIFSPAGIVAAGGWLAFLGGISSTLIVFGIALLGSCLFGGLLGRGARLLIACCITPSNEPQVNEQTPIQPSTQHLVIAMQENRRLGEECSQLFFMGEDTFISSVLEKINILDIRQPGWQEKAISIQNGMTGNEQAILDAITHRGGVLKRELISKAMANDQAAATLILREGMMKNIRVVCHPDSWQSPFATEVSRTLSHWLEEAQKDLEQAMQGGDLYWLSQESSWMREECEEISKMIASLRAAVDKVRKDLAEFKRSSTADINEMETRHAADLNEMKTRHAADINEISTRLAATMAVFKEETQGLIPRAN